MTVPRTREYFVDRTAARAFDAAYGILLVRLHKQAISKYLPPENTQRFRHGGAMRLPPSSDAVGDKELRKHSTALTTKFEDIVEHRVAILLENCAIYVRSMSEQFGTMFYETLQAACDKTGNVVDANAAGSFQEAFLELLEKVEFSVDKNGSVVEPQVLLGSDMFAKAEKEFSATTPEYDERVEATKARKRSEALAVDADRKLTHL